MSWWHNLSVIKKLYAVVGLMAVLVASELFTLLFAMNTLSAVRAFVAGEGLWTKAQKDALHSLYQYAIFGDEAHYAAFENDLKINEGDHIARVELNKGRYNYSIVRNGFLQGGNHPSDIDGMIRLLDKFHQISYLRDAIGAWTRADEILDELRTVAGELHRAVQTQGLHSAAAKAELFKLAKINSDLEKLEVMFSSSLGAGSRWLEQLLMLVLALTVFTVESTGIFLTFKFSRSLSTSLKELMTTADLVGKGDFSAMAPVRSKDELGQLANALNKMTEDLGASVRERNRDKEYLQQLNEDLEQRVRIRTRDAELRESRLRLVTNAMPDLVAQLDKNERFLFVNDAFCNWFGGAREDVLGRTCKEVLGPERYVVSQPYIEKVLNGETTTYERPSQVGDSRAVFNVTFIPETDENGQVESFVFVGNDVSKYKQIEADLLRAKEMADVANQAKSTFLANMSHEIRTPLGAILGFSELMLSSQMTPEERVNGVEVIKRNGQQLSNIINDILDLSKVEAGKLEMERVPVQLDEIVREIESTLGPKATEKNLKLTVTAEGAVPNSINTDPLRLRQILLNIIGNSIKFTHRGSVEVKIKLVTGLDQSVKLGFFVKDTGKGISPYQTSKLFAPFVQADASTTRQFGGTGLGLILSKRLANALGGDVKLVSSSVGAGSLFVVTIDPGTAERIIFQNFNSAFESHAPSLTERRVDLREFKVLVVDDSVDNRTLVAQFLRGAGAIVETANDGKNGVEKALARKYDLVLMDLQMPVMDGYEAARNLRKKGYLGPIVALTAHAMVSERRRCLEGGFDEHISKPVDRVSLTNFVAKYTAS